MLIGALLCSICMVAQEELFINPSLIVADEIQKEMIQEFGITFISMHNAHIYYQQNKNHLTVICLLLLKNNNNVYAYKYVYYIQ